MSALRGYPVEVEIRECANGETMEAQLTVGGEVAAYCFTARRTDESDRAFCVRVLPRLLRLVVERA